LTQNLILYDLRHRLAQPDQRSGYESLVVQLLGSSPSPAERIQVADWLLMHGAPQRVTEVLDEELCRHNMGAAQRWIQARANSGQWQEVAELVEDSSLAISPEIRHCYRAMLSTRAGDTNAAATHLTLALSSLKNNINQIYVVADYAEKLQQPRVAAAAYDKLLPYPLHAARAAREILRLLRPSDDVHHLLTTLRRLREFQPESNDIGDSISWWELVTGQRVEENAKAAADRLAKNPTVDRFRLTKALAYLRQNNPDSALGLLEGRYVGGTNMTTRARLLYVAALGASGQRQTAQRIAATLNVASLKPEEVALVRPWREDANR